MDTFLKIASQFHIVTIEVFSYVLLARMLVRIMLADRDRFWPLFIRLRTEEQPVEIV
ncbi:MAG: hypothetical protein ACLQPN_11165 [Bryobacteraceae bacterium]